jgi:hypothetical protein
MFIRLERLEPETGMYILFRLISLVDPNECI